MRQAEIFPVLIDQNQIDNYVWFQQTLDEFKNKKKIFLNSNANFRKTLNIFTNWHNDDDFEYSKSGLIRQIHKVKRTLEENKATMKVWAAPNVSGRSYLFTIIPVKIM